MRTTTLPRFGKALLLVASLSLLQACTAGSDSALNTHSISVEEAFLTPGIVPVNPYTRSIISSNNF